MTIRLIDSHWGRELNQANAANTALRIISPFIKAGAIARLLRQKPQSIQVITRFSIADFVSGVSDISALRQVHAAGGSVRGIKNLHAKLYLFGHSKVVVTSANLTRAALDRNHEFGFVSEDQSVITDCHRYFDDLWRRAKTDLQPAQLDGWEEETIGHQVSGALPGSARRFPDYGTDIGLEAADEVPSEATGGQAFVKFLGRNDNRVSLGFKSIEEVRRAGCTFVLAYPSNRRPASVENGAIMFMARLISDPNDIRVFGRAIGLQHVPGRDDATAKDIERRPWLVNWPRYIRVHQAEFVAGTMANGISLNELMGELGANAFAATLRNLESGEGNTNPRLAYRRHPAVELSPAGLRWLSDRLEGAFQLHGKIPAYDLRKVEGPEVAFTAS